MAKPKPKAKKAQQKTQKLAINGIRRGELRYDVKYNATEAARSATKLARAGYTVTVQPWRSLGTKRNIQMTCTPSAPQTQSRSLKTIAKCEMTPSFKQQLKLKPW